MVKYLTKKQLFLEQKDRPVLHRLLPMPVLFLRPVSRGYPVEFHLEILREIFGIVEADGICNLRYRQLALLQQFGRPFQADVADEFNGRLAGQQQDPLVEGAPAGVEYHAQLTDGEFRVAHILFNDFQDIPDKGLVGGLDLYSRGGSLDLPLVCFPDAIIMRQHIADLG